MADAEAEYKAALRITLQWLDTWRETDNVRHLDAALACSRIARERFNRLLAERKLNQNHRQLIQIERQAELEANLLEVQKTIAECRIALMALVGESETREPETGTSGGAADGRGNSLARSNEREAADPAG
jgi:hypothetical protein